MSSIEESIDLDVPVRTAYNQWTQFEDFPMFMEGVQRVQQIDDTHLHWVAEIAGVSRDWDAEITMQEPDRMISWRSTTGPQNAGTVVFEDLGSERTRVTLRMDYDPETFAEKAGDVLGIIRARVAGDLRRFKQFIEERRVETGAWRGQVRGGTTTD
jgi:uncharacterized membrane protein